MIKVIDNFLDDPWTVRNYALSGQEWRLPEGIDYFTASHPCEDIFEEADIKARIERESGLGELSGYTAEFRLNTIKNRSWIHTDASIADYTCLIFLNPNAPVDHGTSFFRHKHYGELSGRAEIDFGKSDVVNRAYELHDMSRWERTDQIANVFNRALIFDATKWHMPSYAGFGYNKITGRLTMNVFMKFNQTGEYREYNDIKVNPYVESVMV